MTARSIKFTVLDVGQGTGNFIATYSVTSPKLDTAPDHTVLIDLGASDSKSGPGGPAADWVVDQLERMSPPTLDWLLFSHSDSDHHNLMKKVLESFDPPGTKNPTKKILTIAKAAYGGDKDSYTKNKYNILDDVAKYLTGGAKAFLEIQSSASGFSGGTVEKMDTVDGVDLYLLVGNAPRSAAGKRLSRSTRVTSWAVNTQSLVVMLSYAGVQYVTTGDATGVTMSWINQYITSTQANTYLPNVFMLTLPHHGSETTSYCLSSTGRGKGRNDDNATENVQQFADLMKARTITASAGETNSYNHPSGYLMKQFWSHLQSNAYEEPSNSGSHYYTAYFDKNDKFTVQDSPSSMALDFPDTSRFYTVKTAKDIYTTVNFSEEHLSDPGDCETVILPPNPAKHVDTPTGAPYPELFVAWAYVTTDAGSTDVSPLWRTGSTSPDAAFAMGPRGEVAPRDDE